MEINVRPEDYDIIESIIREGAFQGIFFQIKTVEPIINGKLDTDIDHIEGKFACGTLVYKDAKGKIAGPKRFFVSFPGNKEVAPFPEKQNIRGWSAHDYEWTSEATDLCDHIASIKINKSR